MVLKLGQLKVRGRGAEGSQVAKGAVRNTRGYYGLQTFWMFTQTEGLEYTSKPRAPKQDFKHLIDRFE